MLLTIVANPTSHHADMPPHRRLSETKQCAGAQTMVERAFARAIAPFSRAVRSLLDPPQQRIEAFMPSETDLHASCNRPTVFVIEHEQVVRSALHYILRDRYRTLAFASPDEAFAAAMDAPDAILAGATVLQDLGGRLLIGLRERYGDAVILVVADRSSDPLVQLARESAVDAIVCKPISFETVCEAVDRALAAPIAGDATSRLLIHLAYG